MCKGIRTIYRQVIVAILISALCFLLIPIQSQAWALDRRDFTKINENGFGDPNNGYAWSMAWFKGKLYVGTLRNSLEVAAFTENPPHFDPYPVPVPHSLTDLDLRAEIWQYTPETGGWKRVHQSETFKIMLNDGTLVETARDPGYRVMTVYTDPGGEEALYVGTHIYLGAEARILRTTDGENFQVLTFDPGFELPEDVRVTSFRSFVPFKGRLYTTPVATGRVREISEVQMVFESVDLDLAAGIFHFRAVSPPNFGDETNETIFEMAACRGYLYAGTGNPEKGYQIWKTDASSWPYTWTPVVVDGAYRGSTNQGPASMFPFKGKLYVGSGIRGGGYGPSEEASGRPELIRINPDDSWELICGMPRITPDGFKKPLSGKGPGFGNVFIGYFWRMEEHNDWLYLGTMDNSTFLPYLPLEDLPEWIDVDRIVRRQGGFDLWKTRDGVEWYPVTIRGFGNPLNIGLRTMQSTPVGLFVGTCNLFTAGDGKGHPGGAEVWLGAP